MWQDGQNTPSALAAIAAGFAAMAASNNSEPIFYFKDPAGNVVPVPALVFCCLAANFTGTNVATAQPVFNATPNGAVTLAATTTYLMIASYNIQDTGATSHSLATLFGGTATLTSIMYQAHASQAATNVLAAVSAILATAATAVTVTPAVATATVDNILLIGVVRVNAGGTFIPQFQFSAAPGAAPTITAGSMILLIPVGSNTAASAGLWT